MLREIWNELRQNDITHPDTPMWYRMGNAFLAHAMFAILVNVVVGIPPLWTVPIQAVAYFLTKEVNDIFDGDWRVIPDSLMDTLAIFLGALLITSTGGTQMLALTGLALGWFSYPYRELKA